MNVMESWLNILVIISAEGTLLNDVAQNRGWGMYFCGAKLK